jgi:hypothetical protein
MKLPVLSTRDFKIMSEELEKIYREVWGYLEAGEWLNAAIAAGRLTELVLAGEHKVFIRCVRAIAEIAEKVKNGPKRGAAAKLEEVASALPRLNEFTSFKELVVAAKYRTNKKSVALSVVVGLIFLLLCNVIGYNYLQAQPISSGSQLMVNRAWLGINRMPRQADILLLGDSTCLNNLAPGAVSDRLGGNVINLGNNGGTSLLMDAWMLSACISKYGIPKVVVVSRASSCYGAGHNLEFMADPPLPWAYWDNYGAVPNWKAGEIRELFLKKYGVLYADADVFKERLITIGDLFKCSATQYLPSIYNHNYSAGCLLEKEDMELDTHIPSAYFSKFYANVDSSSAIKCMANLAHKYHFQLYFTLQPEWDEAVNTGLRSEHLAVEKKYLSQFTDNLYVHVVDQVPKTLFTKEQMQNTNHLWHGSEKIYTEEIVNGIIAIQNELTAGQARNMEFTSVSLDKDNYHPGDQPTISLKVTDPGDEVPTALQGGVSCLIKPSGDIDAHWVARAPAKSITLNGDEIKEINLQITAGKLEAGTYDLVVFLRQDVGGLSHETCIEIPKKIIVK